ncbi:MAG: polymerase subunit sigma-70 [Sphingomonas bacterium]|uniref:sigma-70 family RNA polymerase sigma factor n=1 Tax=Sphingomonas bacterium TaxID=1895847 RepID=UPI00263A0356|nr:sigma-70 family RNA polymerase sigma factor [Sphingomonas bacterium]MDB5705115.1 polymerase subunit sigma-70 [Sphingomonas bacterium]
MADVLVDWMGAMRPRLHRYAARMMGSVFDGEDVVQDAMARAAEALKAGADVAQGEAWLFRITHNAALDALRRRRRQEARDAMALDGGQSNDDADRRIAVEAGLGTFLQVAPAQRSCVILMDVLGHSLAETGGILGMTVPAVKAALHRGRTRLRALAASENPAPASAPAERRRLHAYAERFNAHDWDALRALLAADVELDLVNRARLSGARDVSVYFTHYAEYAAWRLTVGTAEGRPALLVHRHGAEQAQPSYIILLEWRDGQIAAIRDFHFAPYVMDGLDWAA